MKKEYVCYYFDKYFKGKINEEDFSCAKNSLFCLLVVDGGAVALNVLKDFTGKYFKIQHDIEKDLEETESIVHNAEYFNCLNFFQKIGYRREFKNLRKTYSNFGRFEDIFYNAYGVSLVKVKDELDREEDLKETPNN